MSKSMYEKKEYKLSELLEKATHNASIFVPDLQRPYVWLPNQVSLLVDSLFRGWPFGTLLTWTVKPDVIDGHLVGIPARTFYTLVSRCPGIVEATATMRVANFATEDTMVLDGQQRLQSLIFAFGDASGICMFDSEWEKSINPTSKARSKNGYSTAGLCLDLARYLTEMRRCKFCRNVNLDDCLRWVVMDRGLCSQNHRGGKLPLPEVNSKDGVFVPLKSMWNMTNAAQNEDEDIEPLAKTVIDGAFGTTQLKQDFCGRFGGYEVVKKDVMKFLRRCCEIKELPVTCLNIVAYSEPQTATDDEKLRSRQEYDDAIVNIFTRLNTAGRTLTREEITFAWVKSTWKDAGVIGDAFAKAEDFVARIREIFSSWELTVDDVIRALSIIWCDHDLNRNGHPLETRELLQAGVIRNMSRFLRTNAGALVATAARICEMYEECHLRNVTDSFNGVTIAWDLYFTGEMTRNVVMKGCTEHDKDNAKKTLNDIVCFFIARWAALPGWGKYWANQAVGFLQQTMLAMAQGTANIIGALDEVTWRTRLKELSLAVNHNAEANASQNLPMRLDERKVYLYRTRLEIWQGLDEMRAKFRSLTFRTTADKGEIVLNVDHIIAYSAWKQRIEKAFADNMLTVEKAASILMEMTDDDIAQKKAMDPGFEVDVKHASVEFINNIGNCMLLNAGYNISKRTKPLSDFMNQMYEFKLDTPAPHRVDRAQWIAAMKLTDELINPAGYTIEEIANAIRVREKQIYAELAHFVTNPEPELY